MKFFETFLTTLLCCLILALNNMPHASQDISDEQLVLSMPLEQKWQYKSNKTLNLSPTVLEQIIFLPLADGLIIALQSQNGALLWKSELGGTISAPPVVDAQGLYIAIETGALATGESGTENVQKKGIIRALDPKSGVTLWTREIERPIQRGLAIDSSSIYGSSIDGKLYSIDKTSGTVVWTARLASSPSSYPTVTSQEIFIGSNDGTLFAMKKVNGQIIWRYKAKATISSNIAVTESKKVIAGSTDGNVFAVSQDMGKPKWHKRTGAAIHSVAAWSENVIAASLDNFVYSLSDRDGEQVWKHRLPGRIYALPLIKMGYALFSPVAGDSCIVLDLVTGKQVNTLPVGEDNNTMAAPVETNNAVLITTRQGLIAFSAAETNRLLNKLRYSMLF